jgi:hypothetical protein
MDQIVYFQGFLDVETHESFKLGFLFHRNKFESTCMQEVYFLGFFGMKNSGPDELFIGFWVVCNI